METLGYKIAVLLHELEDFVVVLGGGVADFTALDDFEGLQIELYGFCSFAIQS